MITKSIKIMVIVLLSLGLIAVILYWWFTKSVGGVNVPSTTNEYVIAFEELNSKLYIRAKSWGMSGNHKEILLSSFPLEENKQCSKDECFVFYASEIYYKKEGTDTLLIYAGASAISEAPKNFSTPIKIKQIELKNYDEVKDYEINYKKYGLSKVSVYKDK
jgi:hypothetical protein